MLKNLLISSVFALTLISCANNSTTSFGSGQGDAVDPVKSQLFGDMPLPPGIKLNNDHSMILGGGNNWAGHVELAGNQSLTDTYVFFKNQFPVAGWTLVSATKSKSSLLVFTKADRIATVEITDGGGIMGSNSIILLTVAPKDTLDPGGSSSSSPTNLPAGQPAQ
ncbi:hypothetical protein LHV13_04050 [Ferrovum sp. PN-J185]|uniref:hypothetical protein n=1 Tax=Ferrovum sp. PN-J185 TaxID=1356306 RepID=UPI000792DD8C|nr:hypothetical protein [Ferrovum sp. PN-J185]KXW56601.1 hypothetical protein FV185_05560 [Ferrovum sp. PN-J185]MCC6068350.1 hypothetical protein [Ferrovum sp. PN-J185]